VKGDDVHLFLPGFSLQALINREITCLIKTGSTLVKRKAPALPSFPVMAGLFFLSPPPADGSNARGQPDLAFQGPCLGMGMDRYAHLPGPRRVSAFFWFHAVELPPIPK
jgi:hypothetical protein